MALVNAKVSNLFMSGRDLFMPGTATQHWQQVLRPVENWNTTTEKCWLLAKQGSKENLCNDFHKTIFKKKTLFGAMKCKW